MSCAGVQEKPASVEPTSDGGLPSRWHYDVTVADNLRQVTAEVCFEGPTGKELRAGKDAAARALLWARRSKPMPGRSLPVRGGRVQLSSLGEDGCLRYAVDLTRGGSGFARLGRDVGRDMLASPSLWLWRPQLRDPGASATLRLRLPEGMQAAVPWPRKGDLYQLPASTFRYDGHAAFGRFEPFSFGVAQATVTVSVLDGPLAVNRAQIERWLKAVGGAVSTVDGRLPADRLQVLIVPSRSAAPIGFGVVGRAGGASVLLFVASDASEEQLKAHWVTPHELSHLFLPFVRRESAWLSEGLATYYQDVLRARAGLVSADEAWRHMAVNLSQARQEGTGRMMAAESAAMYRTYAFRSVYWAGTAYFLMADVELRRRSGGKKSLDRAIATLTARGDPMLWDADDLLRELDRACGLEVFVPLADRVLSQPFPDFEQTLVDLGIAVSAERITLDDQAPLADIRRTIMRP